VVRLRLCADSTTDAGAQGLGVLRILEGADAGEHPLRPHDLRHTFAFQLARTTGADAYELERRLGHRSKRYIQRYTNPPEAIAASYVEQL
jgi:integrase